MRKMITMLGVALMVFAGSSWGAEFPNKPIRIILGGAKGSATDIMLMFMTPAVEKSLGQPVVVDSRQGGGGVLALELMKNSRPDGYTLCGVPDAPLTGTPHMREVSYSIQKDFSSIILLSIGGGVIAAKSDGPFKKFQDLVEYARKNPGKLTMGLAGTGNNVHLGVIQVANHDKVQLQYVPFNGAGPAITALLGGHVMGVSCSEAPLVPHMKAGTLRPLLVLNKKRMAEFPDFPTADELGYPSAATDIAVVKGILTGPKAVPKPVKDKLIAAFSESVRSPEYRKFALQNGLTLPDTPLVGEELDKYLFGISELSGKAIRQIGLQKK